MDGFNLRHLALAVALSAGMGSAFAATDNDFVDNAAAGGIAEIETSRTALEKSQSADIKAFANQMITDHSKANDELAAIAKANDIEVPDTTTPGSNRPRKRFSTCAMNPSMRPTPTTVSRLTKKPSSCSRSRQTP